MIQLDEKSNATLALIPRNAKRVAIIGAKAAQIGTAFHHLSPACHLDKFPNSKRFFQFLTDSSDAVFDAIILTSQSAQQGMPQAVLTNAMPRLTPSGIVIFEVQNPFHFRQLDQKLSQVTAPSQKIIDVLLGKAGVFTDRLKFEIRKSGLTVDRFNRLYDLDMPNWLDQSVFGQNLQADQRAKVTAIASASVFLLRLTRRKVPQLRIQAKILKPVGGVNDVRINEPLAALQTLPGVKVHISENQRLIPEKKPDFEKVFIWQRPVMSFTQSVSMVQSLRKAGYLIIVEFDDHPSPWPTIAENNYLTFAGAHAVQTTNEVLADFIRKHNPHVGVFANQLNKLSFRSLDKPSDIPRIFFGALNRGDDYKNLMPLLNDAINSFEGPFHFDVMQDQAFFEALQTDHKTFHPRSRYQDYRAVLAAADISLMPLLNDEFNRMKSDLKMVEACGAGVVPVANAVVYGKTDPNSAFSEICSDDRAFAAALVKLVNAPKYRFEKQQRAREYAVQHRMLSDHYEDRYNWIMDLLAKRNELDKQLGLRLQKILPK